MPGMREKIEEELDKLVVLVIASAIVGSLIGLSAGIMNWIIEWLVSGTVGAIFSIITASLIESVTGDFLKKILINIKIIQITSTFLIVISCITYVSLQKCSPNTQRTWPISENLKLAKPNSRHKKNSTSYHCLT